MDGTFLRKDNSYDRVRFRKLYKTMKERGIKFVVASGNQYYQLKSFFEGYQEEITYVAENGALIIEEGEEIFSSNIPRDDIMRVAKILEKYLEVKVCLCGRNSAYVLDTDKDFYEFASKYYHKIKMVKDFYSIEDKFLKIATETEPEISIEVLAKLQEAVGSYLEPVHSGHGSIDIILPGINKGKAISMLQRRWGIDPSECMAFGDGGNDIEMLKRVKYSYAMENAGEGVKSVAAYRTASNDLDGVIEVISEYLKQY